MSNPIALGLDRQAGQVGVDLRARLGDYPHRRADVLTALASSSVSVDQLGMALKLGLNRHQVVRGVELAMVNHRKEMADRATASLAK